MKERFDDQLLDEFAHHFYGYGNYSGPFWFVGMEEGGGDSFDEISGRLIAWAERGRCELEGAAEYHAALGITLLFKAEPVLQRTWAMLIRALLSSRGPAPTAEEVRAYQRTSLGRAFGETCLVELLPLPSRSTNDWLYATHSGLQYLIDRPRYQQALLPPRIAHLRQRVLECEPKLVLFYGLAYRDHWRAISGLELRQQMPGIYAGRDGRTLFVMTRHPAARGVTNTYFDQVGAVIATETEVVGHPAPV